MGLFDKISEDDVTIPLKFFAIQTAFEIEQEFNTKVFDYGIVMNGKSDFTPLIPPMITLPPNANYLLYFLVPIDATDNIITNDYYEKSNESNVLGFGAHRFSSALRSDWDLTNFLENKVNTTVYDIGAYRVKEYKGDENTVSNVENIDDLRYRFFRVFASD